MAYIKGSLSTYFVSNLFIKVDNLVEIELVISKKDQYEIFYFLKFFL